ncbi:hypothetical protein [Streptomyces purpurascens]
MAAAVPSDAWGPTDWGLDRLVEVVLVSGAVAVALEQFRAPL